MDSYGDGGGSVAIGDDVLTNDGSSSSMTVCVDLTACIDVTYASTDSWGYENSWEVTDADGELLASGGDASGSFGTCAPAVILGCMDSAATNYNMDATEDDGTCEYPVVCNDTEVTVILMDSWGDGGGSVTIGGETFSLAAGSSESFTSCVDLTVCTDVIYASTDSYAGENSWSVTDASGTELAFGGPENGSFGACGTPGCMDATACNYNMDATEDDGSCFSAAEGFECDGTAICDLEALLLYLQ
jgi:hypothetical protein